MKKLIAIFFLSFIIACQQETAPKNSDTLGTWGGVGVKLNIAENNTDFEFDCATANLKSKLKATDNQILEQFGTYIYEHGGPILVDEKPDIHPARFSGKIINDSMFLSITILDQKRADIPLKLKQNSLGKVFKCL
jgi:hypothetical protein